MPARIFSHRAAASCHDCFWQSDDFLGDYGMATIAALDHNGEYHPDLKGNPLMITKTTNPPTVAPVVGDPPTLNPDQQARAAALKAARDILTFGKPTPPGHFDLITVAQYILDGHVWLGPDAGAPGQPAPVEEFASPKADALAENVTFGRDAMRRAQLAAATLPSGAQVRKSIITHNEFGVEAGSVAMLTPGEFAAELREIPSGVPVEWRVRVDDPSVWALRTSGPEGQRSGLVFSSR